MERRNFLKNLGVGTAALPLAGFLPIFDASAAVPIQATLELLPKRLTAGDTIGIVSPSSAPGSDAIGIVMRRMRNRLHCGAA